MFIVAFVVGLIAAFLSALPMGPVNLAVINASINIGRKAAGLIALGGAVAEAVYCLIGLLGAELVAEHEDIMLGIKIVSIPVLIGLGIYNLYKQVPSEVITCEETRARKTRGAFWMGLSLNFLNPALLPWWMLVSTHLRARDLLSTDTNSILGFGIGVAAGTFLFLFMVGVYGARHREIMRWETRVKINRAIGVLFLVFAVWVSWLVWKDHFHFQTPLTALLGKQG